MPIHVINITCNTSSVWLKSQKITSHDQRLTTLDYSSWLIGLADIDIFKEHIGNKCTIVWFNVLSSRIIIYVLILFCFCISRCNTVFYLEAYIPVIVLSFLFLLTVQLKVFFTFISFIGLNPPWVNPAPCKWKQLKHTVKKVMFLADDNNYTDNCKRSKEDIK